MANHANEKKGRVGQAGQSTDILECNPIPTFAIDASGNVTHWNHACQLLTGIGAEEIIGTDKHREVFYTKRREVLADLIVREASDKELAVRYDGKLRHSHSVPLGYEGELFFPALGENGKWLFFTAAPVKDNANKIVGAIETMQDITALRVAEKALVASEIHYRLLFDYANDAILILKRGNISLCNRKALDLFMRSHKEMGGAAPLDLSPAVQPNGEPSNVAAAKKIAMVLKDEPLVFEWRFLRKNGSPVDTEVSLTRFTVDGDVQVIAIVRDISERKKMICALEKREKELDEKNRNLEKINLALKAALDHRETEKRAVETHLLINLKRRIFPYLETLNNANLDPDVRTYLNIIETNLNDMVSRLSTTVFSKYIDFTPAEIRIADLIREGQNTKEIAALPGLSPSSVKWHRKNIRKKLGLTNNRTMNLYTYLNSLSS